MPQHILPNKILACLECLIRREKMVAKECNSVAAGDCQLARRVRPIVVIRL